MQLKKLSAAVAFALAGFAGQALALTPADIDTPVNSTLKVYLSGASAPQNTLGAIATQMFDAGYLTFYDNGGTPAAGTTADDGKLYRAYFGVVKTGDVRINASLWGKKVLLTDRAKGGSVWGVNPVARAEAIATMQVDASCSLEAGIYRCPQVGVDPGLGTPTGQEVVPDFGVSDVAPNMFKDPLNVEFGYTQLSETEAAVLNSFGVFTLMMGLPATNAVPTTTYLSKASYAGMLTGNLTDWSQVDGSLSGPVVVCRRVPGSGTQTSYNWFFNNFPCSTASIAGSGDIAPARMSGSAGYDDVALTVDPAAGYTVIENSTSGQVRTCLQKAQAGGVHTFTDEQSRTWSVNFGAGGYKAIGVLSLDSAGSESGWSFRNLDGAGNYLGGVVSGTGVAPTKSNLREGNYEFAAEVSMQYRNTTVNGVAPLSADPLKQAFVDDFIKFSGDPDVLNSIASVPVRNASMALPISFVPDGVNNVAKATRFGNMCAPLQKLY